MSFSSLVSRTLDPSSKSLVTVIGLHDHQLTDADVNLIQDLQDYKRRRMVANQVCSGCLSYAPFVYNPYINNTFTIPAFDVMFNGQVVTIGGNNSSDLTQNKVQLPNPIFWTNGASGDPARIWVVFLEMWYAELNPTTGAGYATVNNVLYFYPNGCVNAPTSALIANDTIDPFQGLDTTHRAQIQWGLRAQSVAMSYDFGKYAFGLDRGDTDAETVWGQASQVAPQTGSPYFFTNLGSITGDTGLWRAGDGNPSNDLGTMDGYSYALPMAVALQKNTGAFDISNNIFGCAAPNTAGSGLISSKVSGRFDKRFADSVWADNVVDTRQTIALAGWEYDKLLKEGFVDVITGSTRAAILRGDGAGNSPLDLGSLLTYNVGMGITAQANVDPVGAFNGFTNGFSSDARLFYTTKAVSVNAKTTGVVGGPWIQGDSFSMDLGINSGVIDSVTVQALVTQTDGSKVPVILVQGQISIKGLSTSTVTVSFLDSLTNTSYDPGQNSLYVTLGVQQPVGSGVDLQKVPSVIYGGQIIDDASGKTLPIFGCSEYDTQASQPALKASAVWAINPEYSNLVFGTRTWLTALGSTGTPTTVSGNTYTTFTINRAGVDTGLNGLYPVRAWDQATGAFYTILSRTISSTQMVVNLAGTVDSSSTVVISVLCSNTAQLAYNAAVRGVTAIEETVLFGTYVSDTTLTMDNRMTLVSQSATTLVFASSEGILKGLAGDDLNRFVWVQKTPGVFEAYAITSASFSQGLTTVTFPSGLDLTQPFFFIGSFYPSFGAATQLTLSYGYVPYQGEGVLNRDYEVLMTEADALVTTNGTGAAPIPGLKDIYPYNRELPVISSLPSQITWNDSTLNNQPVQSFFDSNFVAKKYGNVEHTLAVPLHTNDFIDPINQDKRKLIRFITAGGNRGFSKATPHVGFAIKPPTLKTSQSDNTASTTGSIVMYVNNVTGNDANDGLTAGTPLLTITAALDYLPPILRHPCSVQLADTGVAYDMQNLRESLDSVSLGDGTIRSAKYYALGTVAFSVQEAGRLVVTRAPGAITSVVIDATSYVPQGDGPTVGFFVDNTRVIFNGIEFIGFVDAAVYGSASDIEFVECTFTDNVTAGSFDQGCNVVVSGGLIDIADGVGMVLSDSQLLSSGTAFTVDSSGVPGAFFVAQRASSLSLQSHSISQETNVTSSAVIAQASINSSIVCTPDFSTAGSANLSMISVLSRTVNVNPFLGGVNSDSSSVVQTSL